MANIRFIGRLGDLLAAALVRSPCSSASAIASRIRYSQTSRFLTDLSFETGNSFPGSPRVDNLQQWECDRLAAALGRSPIDL
ncbi:hypothetical protein [Anabaena sp. CS-542/02]|uniref:hypothetical protein n=1 Tax=Anabaena sp. CS-542/02 TaxID=3021719 RepID=UPI00232E39B7|nr:hypothetical protein [Anabaena sp. CS-542/02]MDB9446456.1 hypothetical protein [Anabaena sp. CS-542/02]